ncbi:phospholipase D-like domain-containing protein [Kineobactrum salinum]|uniref:Cardiolipin synthase B n=1 Tax=Kineobactrum salinum TaxID=2708301 RepID=A0A6C0U3X7_9GAMM|nr:phospholipase D-like domain-containing protein [Kineobactrum salinum]QIB66638.1 cardiolipin synthase B [Kineobactrum salinum]
MQAGTLDTYRIQLEYALGSPFFTDNQVEILVNGDQIFPAMLEAIAAAKDSVSMVTFVYWTGDIADRFANALAERAEAGVDVRLVLDCFGASRMSRRLVRRMRDSGVRIRWFRPFRWSRPWQYDKRTHRKILVCDARVAFTGGVGIASEWEGDARDASEWRETHLRIEGRAVCGLHSAFLDNWGEAGKWEAKLINYAPDPPARGVSVQIVRASSTVGWTESAALMRFLLAMARQRIRLTSAYFAPDEVFERELLNAAGRGVDIDILIPGRHCDSRLSQLAGQPAIARLLEAGVSIRRFQPTMLHAKVVTIDSMIACVGSINLNHRSMGKDEECSALLLCPRLTGILDRQFDLDCERAQPVDRDRFVRRGLLERVKERLAGLIVNQL